jgi:hypothetical protein
LGVFTSFDQESEYLPENTFRVRRVTLLLFNNLFIVIIDFFQRLFLIFLLSSLA